MFEMLMERLEKRKSELPKESQTDGFLDRTLSGYDFLLKQIIYLYKYSDVLVETQAVLECSKKLLERVYRDGMSFLDILGIEGVSEMCMICHENLPLPADVVDSGSLFFLNCLRHVSHSKCQDEWSGGNYQCAVCRESTPAM
jgi:hypothetical protein